MKLINLLRPYVVHTKDKVLDFIRIRINQKYNFDVTITALSLRLRQG